MRKLCKIVICFILILINIGVVSADIEINSQSDAQNPRVFENGELYPTGELIWEFHDEFIYGCSPVINGVIYFGDNNHKLYAIDANTGRKIWEFEAGDTDDDPGTPAPLVFNGIVYYGAADKKLYALDANTGRKIWEFDTGDTIVADPAVSNGIIYAGNWEDTLYAIDANTGREIWEFNSGEGTRLIIAVTNEIIIVITTDDQIFALNAHTGEKIWDFYGYDLRFSEIPIFSDETVFFCNSGNEIIALDANTGEQKWIANLGDCYLSSPKIFNAIIYVTNNNNQIFAFNPNTGEIIWDFQLGNYPEKNRGSYRWFNPIFSNGVVYVGSIDNKLYALDANTGRVIWEVNPDNLDFYSSVDSNDILFVGSDNSDGELLNPKINAINAKNGEILWEYPVLGLFSSKSPLMNGNMYSLFGPEFFNGIVYITNSEGDVYAIGKPASQYLNSELPPSSTPIPSTKEPNELASAFSFIQNTGTSPLEVSFIDQSSGNPTVWIWDFGDGSTDNIQNPTHLYASEGTYDVSLTVSNGDSIALREKKQITVINSHSLSSKPKPTLINRNSLPDLTITSSSMFYNPDSNIISVNLTIENKGGTNPGKFYLTYFLTDTKTNHPLMYTDTKEIILDRDDANGLEPGEIRNKNSAKTLPIDKSQISSGTYWFGIAIDSRNEIDESDEENNVLYGPEPLHL